MSGSTIRVLFVSHSFPPIGRPEQNVGGMQRVAAGLVTALDERDDVSIEPLVLRTAAKWEPLNVARFLAYLWWELRRRLRRGDVDVIVFSSVVTASICVLIKDALRRSPVKAISIVHGRDVTLERFGYQRLVPDILEQLSAVVPVSTAVARACVERGMAEDRVVVVPNGIDVPDEPDALSREGNGAGHASRGPTPLRLLSVGRQVPRKGFAWFARNVVSLLPEEVEYRVVGTGPDLENVRRAAHEAGVERRVQLSGYVPEDELDAAYRSADLLVMPNMHVQGDMEGFGVVALEACLRGVPVIASDCEGMRDVVSEGINGHRVTRGDAHAFAEVIDRYAHRPDELADLSGRARQHVRHTYSWPVVAEHFVGVLHGVIGAE